MAQQTLTNNDNSRENIDVVNANFTEVYNNVNNINYNNQSNLLINGNFDMWQRNTSFATTYNYTADRWYVEADGTGATRLYSRQAFALGQTDVPNEPTYFFRYDQSVAGSGGTGNNVLQRIEDVRTLAGKTCTFSFWIKTSGTYTIRTNCGQFFGVGGSTAVYNSEVATSIGTTWTKVVRTFNIPSIAGKTLGTSHGLYMYIALPVNTTFSIDIAQVQLNVGDVALPFVPRSYGEELALCRRYCRSLDSIMLRATWYQPTYICFSMKAISDGMRVDIPTFSGATFDVVNLTGSPASGFTLGTHSARDLVMGKPAHGLTEASLYFNGGVIVTEL